MFSDYIALRSRLLPGNDSHRCLIVAPRLKRGPPERLQEARELITAIPGWSVHDVISFSVPNTQRKRVLGSGQLEELKELVRKKLEDITAVFVNVSSLRPSQQNELQVRFKNQIQQGV